MNLPVSAKQVLDKFSILLESAARHPLVDRLERLLQLFKPERIGAFIFRLANAVRNNRVVRTVTMFLDQQLTRAANSKVMERLEQYAILVRLNRPIGILLLLWPTMISLWIAAQGWPDPLVLLV